jgi:hypothetical protein
LCSSFPCKFELKAFRRKWWPIAKWIPKEQLFLFRDGGGRSIAQTVAAISLQSDLLALALTVIIMSDMVQVDGIIHIEDRTGQRQKQKTKLKPSEVFFMPPPPSKWQLTRST